MTTEQNVKQMELKCQQLLKKRNDLLTDIKAKNVEYSIVQNNVSVATMEYQELKDKQDELSAVLHDLITQLDEKKRELQLLEKDIQIAKLSHKSEVESLERDRKLDVLVEQYLECDDFCTEFLKGLGAKVVKRDMAGNPVEHKAVYDIFLEARERARKRNTSTVMRYRRLPNVEGSAASDGGVQTGGKSPRVSEEMSL